MGTFVHCGRNIKNLGHMLLKMVWKFLKKLKIEQSRNPCNPGIPLIEGNKIAISKRYLHSNAHSSLIYYTVVKIWKQPKYPLMIE